MMKKLYLYLYAVIFWLLGFSTLDAQIIDIDPIFPTAEDTITITYDATQGSAGLVNVTQVYTHTGVITNQSSGPTDWQHVQGNWGTDDPRVKMTNIGNNLHQIRYHIRSFYSLPANETLERLAFVFRDQSGGKEGKTETGGDIFYEIFDASSFNTALIEPNSANILEVNESLDVRFATSSSSNIQLFKNGQLETQTTGRELTYTIQEATPGDIWYRVEADNGTEVKKDSFFVSVRMPTQTANPPASAQPGVVYLTDTTAILSLVAPSKNFVHVLGEFNNWAPSNAFQMKRANDGSRYWLEISGLEPGKEYAYQFLINGELRVADPYARKILDPWNDSFIPATTYPNLKPYPEGGDGIVSVLQTAQTPFAWQADTWQKPNNEDLVIYELLVRDFLAQSDFQTLLDTLDYLSDLGINAIELMPPTEFEANDSWGYNPSFMFAADKYYGPEDALKAFIDECHARGIVVILDMVLNHQFGQSPLVQMYWDAANNRPAANSPWFNQVARHPFNVGYDMNHESSFTQNFVDDVLAHWVTEFRFDGYRMDLSKGFTQTNSAGNEGLFAQYDASRVSLIKRMYDELQTVNPETYFILEHFADNQEEKELAEYGMMLWGNLVNPYNEATMGYHDNGKSNFDWISYQRRGWAEPHVVGYMESHDEERLMYKNKTFGRVSGSYSTKDETTALARMEMAASFFFPIPGPKMLWQFGELGYDVSIDDGGRLGRKPIRWNYLEENPRRRLFEVYSALIKLKQEHAVFSTNSYSMSVAGEFKKILLNDPNMNVVILGNFGVQTQSGNPSFQHTGWWYDYFTGDSIEVTNTTAPLSFEAGEYHLYTDQRLTTPPVNVSISNQLIDLGLHIYPNPMKEALVLTWDTNTNTSMEIRLLDLTGRVVEIISEKTAQLPGRQKWEWKRDETIGNGLYILQFRTEEGIASQKILLN